MRSLSVWRLETIKIEQINRRIFWKKLRRGILGPWPVTNINTDQLLCHEVQILVSLMTNLSVLNYIKITHNFGQFHFNLVSVYFENARFSLFKRFLQLLYGENCGDFWQDSAIPGSARPRLLQLQAWVCLGFYKRAADFYEWFIHKMCILDTEILKKCFNYWRKLMN